MVVWMLFILTISVILILALISIGLIWFSSEDGVTVKDLDNVFILDRAYIAQAPRESWNDLD
jgi:hypothetical protein